MNKKQTYLLWLIFAVSLFFSVGASAQTVTKTFKNESLKTVLKEVERQTKMSVIYNVDEVDTNRKITASFKQTPVREVLTRVLGTGNSFDIQNKMITIRKRLEGQESSVQPRSTQGVTRKISGKVVDTTGEPLIGVSVKVRNSGIAVVTNVDGEYAITTNESNPALEFSYIGFAPQTLLVGGRSVFNVTLREEENKLQEVVVTAMGIQRKEKSLTYATQQVKADDLMKVQDPNVANSLEGKISGITITPSAGGAGGASKIILRGNKSILGNSTPLIVVDGIPMSNGTRGQITNAEGFGFTGATEGSDPLSQINPDDIESMNVLKGANAAALYGSAAANGVIMITTKKGREGKLDINFTSNVTFDNTLLTPKLQNTYGADIQSGILQPSSWGNKLADRADNDLLVNNILDSNIFGPGQSHDVHLRNRTANDIKNFFRTGITTNNSFSISGGTEKIRTYFSYANSHAKGMMRNNTYNRNTFAFRQTYNLFNNRLHIDASMNYVQTVTNNRVGGGTLLNPIYHLYTMPRNIDLGYYRDNYSTPKGTWLSGNQKIYELGSDGTYKFNRTVRVPLSGMMQNWAFMEKTQNNPYWLTNVNRNKNKEDRVYGFVSGSFDIYDGLKFQARIGIDHTKYNSESRRYATTFNDSGIEDFGRYWLENARTNEIYADYLLSYNKEIQDWTVSATAGWVAHTVKGESQKTGVTATYDYPDRNKPSTRINLFMTNAGSGGATTTAKSSNWDKAILFTGQVGWKDKIYVDGSFRQDWYRPFRQFKDRGTPEHYSYFGVGANAIVSSLVKLPEWISYLKYRTSYSEVGNSIPNIVFAKGTENLETGAITPNQFARFKNPIPEKTKSFETGLEMSFFGSRLNVDLTYYNSIMEHLYLLSTNSAGLTEPVNSGKVRNQGIESTISYDFRFGKDWRWRTSYNLSYNDNKILETSYNENGKENLVSQDVAGARVLYKKGGSIGDMYVTDFKRDANGHIQLTKSGRPQFETEANKKYTLYAGNMNSKWQMGWSNTINYKNFNLFFLINGRIGGKVISITESYLDKLGLSERTGKARLAAEAKNIVAKDYGNQPGIELPDGSGRIVPIKEYYLAVGGSSNPLQYIYNATNFRLRELSLGYTFRNLLGESHNLSLSFIARNLFFLYKDSPVDPDVSLATGNGLGAFELFNMPSARSYGFSLKLNL